MSTHSRDRKFEQVVIDFIHLVSRKSDCCCIREHVVGVLVVSVGALQADLLGVAVFRDRVFAATPSEVENALAIDQMCYHIHSIKVGIARLSSNAQITWLQLR